MNFNRLKNASERAVYILHYGAYIPTEYYVLHEKRAVYMPIPKVACTSIKNALFSMDGTIGHAMDAHLTHNDSRTHSLTPETRQYFKFAFVRSPFDRLISCYEDKVRNANQHLGRHHFDTAYNHVLLKKMFGGSVSPEMSFAEFLELVSRIPDAFSDGHFKSQYSVLYSRGRQIPDFIGRFERIAEDWKAISSRLGIHMPLPITNRSRRFDTRSYFSDPALVRLAAERYSKDIAVFGYASEYETLLSGAERVRTSMAAQSRQEISRFHKAPA